MVPLPTGVLIGGGVCVALYSAYSLFWWHFRLRDFNEIELRKYSPYIVAEATVTGTMRKARGAGFMTVARGNLKSVPVQDDMSLPSTLPDMSLVALSHALACWSRPCVGNLSPPALDYIFSHIRYIFGDNVKRGAQGNNSNERVAMTSPVRMEMPEGAPGEKVAMTSPVRMEMDANSGSEVEETTYRVSFVMPSDYTMETLPVPKNTNLEIKEVPGHTVAALTFFGGSPSHDRVQKEAEKLRSSVEEAGKQVAGDVMLYQYHPPFAPSFLRKVEVLYRLQE